MKRSYVFCLLLTLVVFLTGCSKQEDNKEVIKSEVSVEEGYWEGESKEGIDKVIELKDSLKIKDDEFVVFYVREDKDYDPWALWLWAVNGGDGSKTWDYTQNFTVEDGIGYMRFKKDGSTTGGTSFIDNENKTGLIIRKKSGWEKDCDSDRIWDQGISNSCVIFSGDQITYNVGLYKPRITNAKLEKDNVILASLSDNYGLDLGQGDSGFIIENGKKRKILDTQNAVSTKDDNYAKKLRITLEDSVDINYPVILRHPEFEGSIEVDVSEFSWKMADEVKPSKDTVLGCVYDSKTNKATFSLWAPTSDSVTLNLYEKDSLNTPTKSIKMKKDKKDGVWKSETKDNIDGWFYDYTVSNSKGRNNVLDPYTVSMAAYRNEGGCGKGAIVDLNSEKSGVQNSNYVTLTQREDAVIYEISVRDFTISKDSGVKEKRGTYKAFIEKLPYLKELGVTHIQLQPVLNFYYTDETNQEYEDSGTASNNNYNWGYDPHNYFTPEGWYSLNPTDPYSRVKELRELIDAAHENGLGVTLDVVYNHMANTSLLDDIVPGYYFRTKNGKLTSNSGCGNDVATERSMASKLIVDSVYHWVKNYKVDGFRFDLMGLIDTDTMYKAYEKCSSLNPSVLFVGEGWSMYNGPSGTQGMEQKRMLDTDNISVFNDELRDMVKAGGFNEGGQGFITGNYTVRGQFFHNMVGEPEVNYKTDDPGDNVQYLVCHDGLTLHDNVFNNTPLDESIPSEKEEGLKRIKMGNFITLTSQGVAFLHGGQERGRSKPKLNATTELQGNFVRNSYDASDNINQIVWTLDESYEELLSYTKGLLELRRNTSCFKLGTKDAIDNNVEFLHDEIMGTINVIAYKIHDEGYTYYVVLNASKDDFTLVTKDDMSSSEVLTDAKRAGSIPILNPVGVETKGNTITLSPLTCSVVRVR